jgi:hypothetical protein
MRWTPQSNAFSVKQFMTSTANRQGSQHCVPVSITASNMSKTARLIAFAVHELGWTLGQDGNLYSPNPAETGWGERVA